jgi:hypothetical protein
MTAGDLIAELQKRDPKTIILLAGYENGVQTIPGLKTLTLRPDTTTRGTKREYGITLVDKPWNQPGNEPQNGRGKLPAAKKIRLLPRKKKGEE